MITDRLADQLGIGAIVVMLGLLLLVGFHIVPPAWDVPLFILAVLLFAARLAMRFMLQKRKEESGSPPYAS
jgi:hypothetical protein